MSVEKAGEDLLDQFVERRLAGLEEKDRAEFFRRLEKDAEFRQAFRDRVNWEADLWRIGQEGGFSEDADASAETPAAPAESQLKGKGKARRGIAGTRRPSRSRSSWRWTSMLIAASVLIAAGLLLFWPPDVKLIAVGPDTVLFRDNKRITPKVGFGIQDGDVIETTEGQRATLQFRSDGTRVALASSSRVTVASTDQRRFRVEQGRLQAWVAPQPREAPMVVESSDVRLEVLGTRFDLAVGSKRTMLGVSKGKVLFTRPDLNERVNVNGGEFALAESGKPVRSGKLSLIGWWKFDGDLRDSSPTGMGGILEGSGKAQYVSGPSGKALKLNGDDQRMWVPENPLWDTGSTRSMCCWFRTARAHTDNKGGGLNSTTAVLYFNPASNLLQTSLVLEGNREGFKYHTDPKYADGKWHHVVFVFDRYARDAKRVKLYFDGKVVHTAEGADADIEEGGGLTLGYFNYAYCNFAFDDVALFHVALTGDQVKQLYERSRTPGNLIDLESRP